MPNLAAAAGFEASLGELESVEREQARMFAHRALVLLDLDRQARAQYDRCGIEQFLTLEVAGTSRCGQGSAQHRLVEARRLVEDLPATFALLQSGGILVGQARVVLEATAHVTEPVAREVDRRTFRDPDFPRAAELNSFDLRRRVKTVLLTVEAELDAAAAAAREAAAIAGRRTWHRPVEDAMVFFGAILPAETAAAFTIDLDLLAAKVRAHDRAVAAAGGPAARSLDRCRADVLAGLPGLGLAAWAAGHRPQSGHDPAGTAPASGGPASGGPASGGFPVGCRLPAADRLIVHVHVPMSTALGDSDSPGQLTGYGPISAGHTRRLLPDATLNRVPVDPATGTPLDHDPTLHPPRPRSPGGDRGQEPRELRARLHDLLTPWTVHHTAEPGHDPSAALARYVDLRDQHCTGPGCAIPVGRTDRDHLIPYPDGPTAAWNIKNHSRRCHRAKHHGWTITIHPDNSTTWTSPTGREYWRPSPHSPPPRPRPRSA